MHQLSDGRLQCRALIIGQYAGTWFVFQEEAGSGRQFIYEDGDPSSYWWSEGNMGCDCNRREFLPAALEHLVPDGCGEMIRLYAVIPYEDAGQPILRLQEIPAETPPPPDILALYQRYAVAHPVWECEEL